MKDIISRKRKEKGLTQQELGDLLHVSDRVISKWETGRSVPDTSIIKKLCETLDISINNLFDFKDEEISIEDIASNDFNTKYKNLTIIGVILEIIVGLFLIIGRMIYQYERFDYENSRFLGIFMIVLGTIIFILGVGYLTISRNNLINLYSKYKNYDKKFLKRLIIGLFILIFACSIVFILEHGLETSEVLIMLIICLSVDTIICGTILFLNHERK